MKTETHRHSESAPWSYADLDLRQRVIRDEVLRGEAGRVIFSEVSPVITLGYRKTTEDLLYSSEEYERLGIGILPVTRGGRATYHGPGQWVVFIVDSLERLTGDRKGVRKYVDTLFRVALEVCQERYPHAEVRDGKEAGIWSEKGSGGRKLAALGVQIDQGVTQHGLSLNVFPTASSFKGLLPCGLEAPVGFLEKDGLSAEGGEAAFLYWKEKLAARISAAFP